MVGDRVQSGGQIIALFALSIAGLIVAVGLVVDGGYAWGQRREAQNAADFAALAGARVILQEYDGALRTDGDVASALAAAASANGASIPGLGTSSGALYTDARGIPLPGPQFVGPPGSVSAIPSAARGVRVPAETEWRPFLLGFIGIERWTATAVATARFDAAGSSPCAICILDGVASTGNAVNVTANGGSIHVAGSISSSNSTRLTANGGSIVIDGDIGVTNSSQITAVDGSIVVDGDLSGSNSTRIVADTGTLSISGDLTLSNSSLARAQGVSVGGSVSVTNASTVTPAPTSGGPVDATVSDPLAWLSDPLHPNPGATPQSYSCTNSQTCSFNPGLGTIASVTVSNSATANLVPGIYDRLRVQNSSTVNLHPGTYYFAGSGGGVAVDNSSRIIGTGGVTLVFLDQQGLSASNATGLQLTAPNPGLPASASYPWPGVAIYFARGNGATLSLANSASAPIVGAIYARDATLTSANSTSLALASVVVVAEYRAANSSSLAVTYDPTQNPTFPGGTLQLVE